MPENSPHHDATLHDTAQPEQETPRALTSAAERALKEAAERRADIEAWEASREAEQGGRGGKDPVRYGDWEVKGVACDF